MTTKINLYEGLGIEPTSNRDQATALTKVEGESSEESSESWMGVDADFVSRSKPSETSVTAAVESSDELSIDITSLTVRETRTNTTTELTESGETSDKDSSVVTQFGNS